MDVVEAMLNAAMIQARAEGREQVDDAIADLLDRVTGWCRPEISLAGPEPIDAVARMAALGWPDYDYL